MPEPPVIQIAIRLKSFDDGQAKAKMGPIERNRLIHVVNDVTNRSHIRIRSEITLKSCDGTLKITEPDVKKGSKPDIPRHSHLRPLSGAKRTLNVRFQGPMQFFADDVRFWG